MTTNDRGNIQAMAPVKAMVDAFTKMTNVEPNLLIISQYDY